MQVFQRIAKPFRVALRKESVDRNILSVVAYSYYNRSLSARRAWIEIINNNYNDLTRPVALRKESVDRNNAMEIVIIVMHASLSARRAWIEI